MLNHLSSISPNTLEPDPEDEYLWIITTISLLRDGHWQKIDSQRLIEELEDMGKDKRRELKSRLVILLMHLLKYQYQPEKRSSSWISTILEQYDQLEYLLEDSPSLRPYYLEIFNQCYLKAVRNASAETQLPLKIFPEYSPFSPEEILNSDYIFSII